MKKSYLEGLATKAQLKIEKEEFNEILKNFNQLEKSLVNFRKLKLGKAKKEIIDNFLTIEDIEELQKKIPSLRIKKKYFSSKGNFIIHKKNN